MKDVYSSLQKYSSLPTATLLDSNIFRGIRARYGLVCVFTKEVRVKCHYFIVTIRLRRLQWISNRRHKTTHLPRRQSPDLLPSEQE